MQIYNKNYFCFDFRTCLKCAHWAKKSDKTCMGEKSGRMEGESERKKHIRKTK